MLSRLLASGLVALNSPCSPNLIPSAVEARKEPPISSRALAPKTIPLGLRKNKLAVPLARINPSILEILPPVTRVIMLSIVVALLKKASPPVGTENSEKLWNRLLPRVAPPSILSRSASILLTTELSEPKVRSGMTCAFPSIAGRIDKTTEAMGTRWQDFMFDRSLFVWIVVS